MARAWKTLPSFSLPLPSFPLPPSPFPRLRFSLPFCFFPSASSFPLSPPFLLSLPFSSLHFLYLLFEVARAWKSRAFPFPFHLSFLLFTFIFLSFTSFPLPPSQILPSLLLLSPCLPPSPFPHPFPFPFPSFPLLYVKWLGPGRPGPSPSLSTFPSFSLPLLSFPLPPSPFLDSPFPSASFPLPSSFPLSPPFLLSLPFPSLLLLCPFCIFYLKWLGVWPLSVFTNVGTIFTFSLP